MAMTIAEKIAVMQAFEDGKPIECMNYDFGVWELCDDPQWNWLETDYRVAITKPSWDWSHVSDEIKYLVRQPSAHGGEVWGLSSRPELGKSYWYFAGSLMINATALSSFTPGTCPWEESLVVRPGYKEDSQ